MAKRRKTIGILVGGRTPEHSVSLHAAANVYRQVKANGFRPLLIGIDLSGRWFLQSRYKFPDGKTLEKQVEVSFPPGRGSIFHSGRLEKLDAVFPLLHGPNGEDGAVQGLLRLAQIPFVGEDVLASALCMDKGLAKSVLAGAGLPVPPSLILRTGDLPLKPSPILQEIGLPLFVKPCNAGSSVGVSLVAEEAGLDQAVGEAFRYDSKIIVEKSMQPCREINCALLGSPTRVSLPGEVVLSEEFYSYGQKQVGSLSRFALPGISSRLGRAVQRLALSAVGTLKLHSYGKTPADLPDPVIERVQELAVAAFEALGCESMARADIFLDGKGRLYVNEVNTMPAFDRFSIYPRLWEAEGMTQKELVGLLIEQAFRRFQIRQDLRCLPPES